MVRGSISKLGVFGGKAVRSSTDKRVADMMLGGTERLGRFMNAPAFKRGYGAMGFAQKTTASYGPSGRYGQRAARSVSESMARRQRAQRIGSGMEEVASNFFNPKESIVARGAVAGARTIRRSKILPGAARGARAVGGVGRFGASAISAPGTKGNMTRFGLLAGMGVGGFGMGAFRGARQTSGLLPVSQTTGTTMYGTGYYTWAKARGGGMPANHGSTQGLSLAMHRARRR
jgi:hypothetical protein